MRVIAVHYHQLIYIYSTTSRLQHFVLNPLYLSLKGANLIREQIQLRRRAVTLFLNFRPYWAFNKNAQKLSLENFRGRMYVEKRGTLIVLI
jgi:hypothetical protein